jgi:hypothetical protein
MVKKRHIECDEAPIDYQLGILGDKKDREHRLIQIPGQERVSCETCGKLYPKKRLDLGYTTCIQCAGKTVKRYVGRRYDGRHDGTTEIFRTKDAIESAKLLIRRENAIGYAPNVGVSHPVAVQKWEK